MTAISTFRNLERFRKTFRNWPYVLKTMISHGSDGQSSNLQIPLKFRDDSNLIVTHLRSISVAVGYSVASTNLGNFSLQDLKELLTLADTLGHEIDHVIQPDSFKLTFSQKDGVLFALVRNFKPNVFVETGVAYGVSSTAILKAMDLNGSGKLISVDLPNKKKEGYAYADGTQDPIFIPEDKDPGWIVPGGLRKRWDLRLGKSSDVLPQIGEVIDVFFHDSEHSYQNMMFEFEWAYEHLVPNGIIGSDDFSWNQAFPDFVNKFHLIEVFPGSIDSGFVKKD